MVDLLPSSAANAHDERVIDMILTGSGSVSAAGAVDIKNAGSKMIIQNPQTAHYPCVSKPPRYP